MEQNSIVSENRDTLSSNTTIQEPKIPAPASSELTAERAAQVDSVLRIIKESIEKLKISLILPRVFENPMTLRLYLNGTEYEKLLEFIEAYIKERRKESKLPPQLNYPLLKLIDMFHENTGMLSVLPDWLDELSNEDKKLLEAFHMLYSITEQRFHKSAMSELTKEKKIHQIYHENEQMKKNIVEFKKKLRNQKIQLRWKLAAKEGIIKKYEEDLSFKKWDNNIRIKQEIAQSTRRMRNIHTTSVARQKELEEELEKTRITYEKVLKQNLQQEKEARDEKNKLLLQLQALIKKFDQNIGEKIKENIYLQKEYDEQKKQFDEFLIEYHREEHEYETIIKQKEEEDRRKHQEKLIMFMMNRSARIIQRAWRRYRREKKKKAKKAKGKKK